METVKKTVTTEKVIEDIIQEVKGLQEAIKVLKTFPFLSSAQREALRQTDLEDYIYCLPPEKQKELFDTENCTTDIPFTIKVFGEQSKISVLRDKQKYKQQRRYKHDKEGKYVLVGGKLKLYEPKKHSENDRIALDIEGIRSDIQEAKKQGQNLYWNKAVWGPETPPKDIIAKIDVMMRPHLPFIRENTDLDIRQAIIGQGPETADIKVLDDVIHELRCVKGCVDAKAQNEAKSDKDIKQLPVTVKETRQKEPLDNIYREINLAERTITIGEKVHQVSSNLAWGFLKTLVENTKNNTPTYCRDLGNNINWKNAVDVLRRLIGKIYLKTVVTSRKGIYYLNPSVNTKYGSQISIRKTK